MIQTQDLDSKSDFEETMSVEPVECQPQEAPSQESHEADQIHALLGQLEQSDE